MARLATVWPAAKLRFEVGGELVPVGKALSQPADASLVAVRFMTTADTPVAETPPWPPTWKLSDCPGPSAPMPLRVSRILADAAGRKIPTVPVVVPVAATQPATSRMTSVEPAALKTETRPPLPTPTTVRLARVCPATKFMFDATGRAIPVG